MKLNPDCIRDILFAIEEKSTYFEGITLPDETPPGLAAYTTDEILYHVRQCDHSGLLLGYRPYLGGACSVKDLSPSGHSFLADVRTDSNWEKVKASAGKVGSVSLPILIKIAADFVMKAILGE